MKTWFLLLFFPVLLHSCKNPDKEIGPENQFNRVWNVDSTELVFSVRTQIAAQYPKTAEGLYCKAWLADLNGDQKKAIKTVDSLVIGFPRFEKGLYLRANLRTKLNDNEGAFSDFGKAIKKNPDFFEAYVNRGSLNFQTKHTDLALKDFQKADKIKPNQMLVLLNIGHSLIVLGKLEEACSYWKTADSLGMKEAKLMVSKYCKSIN